MHATGHGELWMDWDSTSKFSQYGWRCTTNENDYSTKTLMGNRNEERYDIQRIVQPKPLPSQYTHCFETTCSSDYNRGRHQRIKRFEREPHWFPGHHPELERASFNPAAQSCYTIDYKPPYSSIFFACVQHSEKEQEGCRKSSRDGKNLQTMPSEKQACLPAVLQGYPSSKKTCHALKLHVAS
ncbi:PREDICTED: UPF0686 protein C11orf1 homolog [Pygoscelis adeliae]|uniref:UPF0686 protein C11orf1 homolog n=1 Tax=Pygoscelis adeliae TaxID=9238 RepID=UPI0004F4E704|nr:PREDICTED: UPF0686 protein C11orf1 homolog [Pygoscelis adeliae]